MPTVGDHGYVVLARDADFGVLGPVPNVRRIEILLRFNAVGTISVDAPAYTEQLGLLTKGGGLLALRDGEVLTSGSPDDRTVAWSLDSEADSGPGSLSYVCGDDLRYVAEREVYPTPLANISAQTDAYYKRSNVNAEGLARDLVRLNAGPDALADRRVPTLTLGPSLGLSGTASVNARGDMLGDVLRSVALQGGGFGFRVRHALGSGLVFETYQPRDLSAFARFSPGLSNLRSYTLTESAPTNTRPHIAGQGEGAARRLIEYANFDAEAEWSRRVEGGWIDRRDTADEQDYSDAAREALIQGAGQASLSTVTVDTPSLRFGADDDANGVTGYGLGDRVSVELAHGAVLTEIVREVHITVTPEDGEQVTALVGSADASSDPAWLRQIAGLAERLGRTERA